MSDYEYLSAGEIKKAEPSKKKCIITSVVVSLVIVLVFVGGCVLYPLLFAHPQYYKTAVVKGAKPDTASWNAMLAEHISEGKMEDIPLNVVDYAALAADTRLPTYLKSLAEADLSAMTRHEFYATYMNAYNVFAMNMIIQHPCKKFLGLFCTGPIDSIRDVAVVPFLPVWKTKAGVLGGTEISLDEIESTLRDPSNILSTDNKEDPRLHACIVCASISCPNIRAEAFQVDIVEDQMDDQMRNMFNNTMKGFSLDKSSDTIMLSKIFFWYGKDFTTVFATDSIVTALKQWFPQEAQDYIASKSLDAFTVDYFDYNWNANGDVTTLN